MSRWWSMCRAMLQAGLAMRDIECREFNEKDKGMRAVSSMARKKRTESPQGQHPNASHQTIFRVYAKSTSRGKTEDAFAEICK